MKLYSYFRSSAAFRVRIALNLKGLPYDTVPVHLVRHGGEQQTPAYRQLNPEALVPTLIDDAGRAITQSLAIIEWLDETHPEPPLLPRAPLDRAWVRALALHIACDIHPLDNLRVLRFLVRDMGLSDAQKNAWYRHWIETGFTALEQRLAGDPRTGTFCFGDAPTLADAALVPQVYNARRFDIDVARYPAIARIDAHAMRHPAFSAAAPEQQPDAA
ncbi:MAG: maleylacetoacetate isomerase [Burkholderiaceae bacterium]|jgi:maleylpyruvate isomerase|nr:maleylacetoacetate isomerase [Burkholderiaceae bacterium]